MGQTELLSPAGDFETALAAFDAGADAVYLGLTDFSARAFAKNFTIEDLDRLMRVAHARGKKVYVTFNTLIDESDIDEAVRRLAALDAVRPDALIVQDLGVARLCRTYFPGLALHASTQLVAHNLEGVLALKELGFVRVVLARELSLAEVQSIATRCGVELEVFIHGALCYSLSGLCLFSAMEKSRSGNRGTCAYCCRGAYDDGAGGRALPFSMKDLRLGADVLKLVEAGVASLKIEGRMKSALYVASVTKFYRQFLDGTSAAKGAVRQADLETVFSRRTTELYLHGAPAERVIDPVSLGHLGTPIGTVKRVTRDREGNAWLRFHTARALERHDGLQFAAKDGGKPVGLGITRMRRAISRENVFEVPAGSDVEILVPDELALTPGETVYCSMSNAVRRMFPAPVYRPSDYTGRVPVDVEVTITPGAIRANGVEVKGSFTPAKSPEKTFAAVEKAFSKLGETDYRLGRLTVRDPDRLFAPMSVLNDLRRDLVEQLDDARARARQETLARALADTVEPSAAPADVPSRVLKIRLGQPLPQGDWEEVVVCIDETADPADLPDVGAASLRLALPVYTPEPAFNRLRAAVKRFLRAGCGRWEASDLATLRLLTHAGVTDVTGDWTLYAFNASALASLSALGVRRFVASPENGRDNLAFLAESGFAVECLAQQATPLFISLTEPAAPAEGLAVFRLGRLWVTTKNVPRTFAPPPGAPVRIDLSWNPA